VEQDQNYEFYSPLMQQNTTGMRSVC